MSTFVRSPFLPSTTIATQTPSSQPDPKFDTGTSLGMPAAKVESFQSELAVPTSVSSKKFEQGIAKAEEKYTEQFQSRHNEGLRGVPPELRQSAEIKQIMNDLSDRAKRGWSEEQLFHLVRGFKFGLQAMKIPEAQLSAEINKSLECTYPATLLGTMRSVIGVLVENFREESLMKKILIGVAAAGPASIMIGVVAPIKWLSNLSSDQIGSTLGPAMTLGAKNPVDLGIVAAHEVVHRYQDQSDAKNLEFFPWAVHSAYCHAHNIKSKLSKIEDEINARGGPAGKGYSKDFNYSGIACMIVRGVRDTKGEDAAIAVLQEARHAYSSKALHALYAATRE